MFSSFLFLSCSYNNGINLVIHLLPFFFMVYLVKLLQPCSVFFPETKQNNATHSTTANPKFFPTTKHSKLEIFPRNQTQQTHIQTQQTQRITIPSFCHSKNHSKLKESSFLRWAKGALRFAIPSLPSHLSSPGNPYTANTNPCIFSRNQTQQTHTQQPIHSKPKPIFPMLCFFHKNRICCVFFTETKPNIFVWFVWKKHSKPMLCFSFRLIGKICFQFPSISSSSSSFLQLLLF